MLCKFVVDRHLASRFVVDHYDRRRIRESELFLVVMFGAKVLHVVEEHMDVGCGHAARATCHYFCFTAAHRDGDLEHGVGFDDTSSIEYETGFAMCVHRNDTYRRLPAVYLSGTLLLHGYPLPSPRYNGALSSMSEYHLSLPTR